MEPILGELMGGADCKYGGMILSGEREGGGEAALRAVNRGVDAWSDDERRLAVFRHAMSSPSVRGEARAELLLATTKWFSNADPNTRHEVCGLLQSHAVGKDEAIVRRVQQMANYLSR